MPYLKLPQKKYTCIAMLCSLAHGFVAAGLAYTIFQTLEYLDI